MVVTTKNEIINEALFTNDRPILRHPDCPWAFCVHTSVVGNLADLLCTLATNTQWEIFEYTLQIDTKQYDMHICIIKPATNEKIQFIRSTIENSQFSFPWLDTPTLFINVTSFHIMQQFIRKHNLEGSIAQIEIQPGISAHDELIKVVKFNHSTELAVTKEFGNYLSSIKTYQRPHYYYITFAFPWLQSYWLKKKTLDDDLYAAFLIILNHLGTLNYGGELNIFDLLSIRWGLSDFRNPYPSTLLKYEIDYMIKRELVKIVDNSSRLLDLDQYLSTKNDVRRDLLITYFVYEFQSHFDTINIDRTDTTGEGLGVMKIRDTIEPALENDVLGKLKEKFNVDFNIDGRSYDRMSISLFLDLIECDNVRTIFLATNHQWVKDDCELIRSISNSGGVIDVYLIGNNTNNFCADFASSLTRVTLLKGRVSLHVQCPLNDCSIFDEIMVGIYLYDFKIDYHMLLELHSCNLKSFISFVNCTLENKRENWELLNNLRGLDLAAILEDEGTWQSMFEFISDQLLKFSTNEFRFASKFLCILSDDHCTTFENIKFTVDELKSKLEIRNIFTNAIDDLYHIKFGLEPDDKFDYDFYQ